MPQKRVMPPCPSMIDPAWWLTHWERCTTEEQYSIEIFCDGKHVARVTTDAPTKAVREVMRYHTKGEKK